MPRRGCVCAPKKATRLILEDNDPTGYRPKKGVVAKGKAKLSGSDFPKRGPDLNPCDYGLWREVDRRTRKQEKKFAKGKTEARKQHAKRLSRTAKNLSATPFSRLVGGAKHRLGRCYAARGGLLAEGGKSTKAENAAK